MPSPIPSRVLVAREHNAQHARLTTLPVELLTQIASDLHEPLAVIYFRISCRQIYHAVASPLDQLSTYELKRSSARQLYVTYLRGKVLDGLCAREETMQQLAQQRSAGKAANRHIPPAAPLSELACSSCLVFHPSELFFASALHIPPRERKCKGTEGVLNMCEHKQVTRKDLHHDSRWIWCSERHGVDSLATKEQRICGGSDARRGERGCLLASQLPRPSRQGWYVEVGCNGRITRFGAGDKEEREEHVYLWLDYVLLQCKAGDVITGDEVKNLVPELVKGVCPHLTISDVKGLTVRRPYEDCVGLKGHGVEAGQCVASGSAVGLRRRNTSWFQSMFSKKKTTRPGKCGHLYRCSQTTCATSFTLFRTRINLGQTQGLHDELVLTVYRDFGPMKDPTDPKWTVQLEEPKRTVV